MKKGTFTELLNIWNHISKRRRRQFGLLLLLTLFSACSEIVSLGSALPFIGIITEPDKVYASPMMVKVIQWFGIKSAQDLIVPLAIAFGLAALISGGLRLLLMWTSIWLGNATGTDLGVNIYRKTLYQPYRVHLARSSSEVISGITLKVGLATSVIVSVVTFITTVALFIAIMGSLLVVDPILSVIASIIFGAAYSIVAWNTRHRLMGNSQVLAQQQNVMMRSLREGLGAIREVLLEGAQKEYAKIYRDAALKMQKANSENSFFSQAPRYLMETLGMFLIALFVLTVSYGATGLVSILPKLGLLALGAQRLLPLMQQIYASWSTVIGSKGGLVDVLELLDQPLPAEANQAEPLPLPLNSEIKFEHVSFQYSENSTLILKQIDLVIPKGARVGIVGHTGSGKSTMLDLLMGLLEPTHGELLVDNSPINVENRRAWQRTIAHVPQMIFLTDTTIAENIAFGVSPEQIDYQRVHEAAKLANAHKFIESSINGYNTFVGEQGIRLSGGQRQRIGIARALYKQASVLCFDEATSALDNNTESDVMDTINCLSKEITVLIIAHRLTTLKNCTHFIKLGNAGVERLNSYTSIELECG